MARSGAFFHQHPVFDRARFAADRPGASERTTDSLLRYHAGRGNVVRLRRSLYASVPPGGDPATWHPDPALVACLAVPGAVIAYGSALDWHGLSYAAQGSTTTALAGTPPPRLTFRGHEWRWVRPPRSLRTRLGADAAMEFEVLTTTRAGSPVRVTSPERTLVDVLDRPDLASGLDHVWESLSAVRALRPAPLLACVEALGSPRVTALVGYRLETLDDGDVSPALLDALERRRAPRPVLAAGGDGVLVRRWNLVVPPAWVAAGVEA